MEFFEKEPVSLYLADLELLEERSSNNYNKIQLFRHKTLGRVLILDGEIQNIEAWAPLYHETIVHLPTAFIKTVRKVLILGGGCFFAAREVLKYSTVTELHMIDFDEEVVDLVTEHYQHAREIRNDTRFRLTINDAFSELSNLAADYDLVINDSIDLLESPFGPSIFKTLLSLTKNEGICVDMVYRHVFERQTTLTTVNLLEKQGINMAYSLLTAPEYPGVLHLLVLWSRTSIEMQNIQMPINDIQQGWISLPKQNPCEFYSPHCLRYYLYLPPYIKSLVHGSGNL